MLKIKKISRVSCKRGDMNAGFWKFEKRGFFLKYLDQKGRLDLNSSKKSANLSKIDSIDLKDLLNEKNISVSIFDILTDYRNFRREYYTFASEKNQEDTTKLPFERKETNIKNIIYYFLFSDKFSDFGKMVFLLLVTNIIFFIINWRKQRIENLNLEILSKMDLSYRNDQEEKQIHSLQKWKSV